MCTLAWARQFNLIPSSIHKLATGLNRPLNTSCQRTICPKLQTNLHCLQVSWSTPRSECTFKLIRRLVVSFPACLRRPSYLLRWDSLPLNSLIPLISPISLATWPSFVKRSSHPSKPTSWTGLSREQTRHGLAPQPSLNLRKKAPTHPILINRPVVKKGNFSTSGRVTRQILT
jgi:hypothetical protein